MPTPTGDPLTPNSDPLSPSPPQSWVQFDNDEAAPAQEPPQSPVASLPPPPARGAYTPAVIDAHSVQVS